MARQDELIEQARKIVADIETAEILRDAVKETDLVVQAQALKAIGNAEQYHAVVAMRGLLKDAMEAYHAEHDPGIEDLKEALQAAKDRLDERIFPLNDEYKRLGQAMGVWNDEQQRIQQRAQLQADIEAEEQKKELAKLARQAGDKGYAKRIMETPAVSQVIPSGTPKAEGVSYAEEWHYSVDSFVLLVKAVAAGKVPIQALHDTTKPFRSGFLNTMTKKLKNTLNYPGVKTWMTKSVRQQ